jgi:hypothetical protein
MAQAAVIIALSERLRKQSHRARNHRTIADLRLATRYLRGLAALSVAEEAEAETEPKRKARLERKFIQLYCDILR